MDAVPAANLDATSFLLWGSTVSRIACTWSSILFLKVSASCLSILRSSALMESMIKAISLTVLIYCFS